MNNVVTAVGALCETHYKQLSFVSSGLYVLCMKMNAAVCLYTSRQWLLLVL
jgi:hypothetical protein